MFSVKHFFLSTTNNPKAAKDAGETVGSKLRTLVRNEMLWGTEPLSRVSNESRYLHPRGLRMEDFERERVVSKNTNGIEMLDSGGAL